MFTTLRQSARLLLDGLRSAALLKPRPTAYESSLPATVLIGLSALGAAALFEYTLANGGAWFNPQGILLHAVTIAALIATVGLAPVARTGASSAGMLAGTLALATALLLLASLLLLGIRILSPKLGTYSPPATAVTEWTPIVLASGFLVALLRLGFGLAFRLRPVAALLLASAVGIGGFAFPNAPIFMSRETEMGNFSLLQSVLDVLQPKEQEAEEAPRPRIDAEAAMMRQPRLMTAALASLQPPRPGRAEFYFLGFAPFASQDVFKREVNAVRQLFDDRFGTAGRSLVLVNHRDTIQDQPLASMSNLAIALDHIGRLMRTDRDVLVLFVTSHGSKGQIAVQFPGFPLNIMTPDRLLAVLDRSGIVNRVLVLSACHSGSFVDRLSTDTTLILTAAHAEKTSFGCSNENEWTYFGDAYFNHALRTETSLIDAFETARTLIASWEKKEDLEPSEPQIFIGPSIKAKLDAIPLELGSK